MQKRLVKSKNRVFTGVLGGVSEYFDWEPTCSDYLYDCDLSDGDRWWVCGLCDC